MHTIFIAGSIAISRLHPLVKERIGSVVRKGMAVVVGDADGADRSIQEELAALGARQVTVFCSADTPRNNVSDWPVHGVETAAKPGTRRFFTAKDVAMAEMADYGLMIWDAKSTGTLSNVIELLKRGRTSVVFVNKLKEFITVSDVATLRRLIGMMSAHAVQKAEEKIGLSRTVLELEHDQLDLAL